MCGIVGAIADRDVVPVLQQLVGQTPGNEAQAAGIEDWDRWWDALGAHPEFAAAMAERSRVWGPELHVAPPKVTLGFHLETLRSAGFREVDTVWRYLDDHVVCALR